MERLAELSQEARAGRRQVLGWNARRGHAQPVAGRAQLSSDLRAEEGVGPDELRARSQGRAKILDEPLRVQLSQTCQVDRLRVGCGDRGGYCSVAVEARPLELDDLEPELPRSVDERVREAESVVVFEILVHERDPPCPEPCGYMRGRGSLCDVVGDHADVAPGAVRCQRWTRRRRSGRRGARQARFRVEGTDHCQWARGLPAHDRDLLEGAARVPRADRADDVVRSDVCVCIPPAQAGLVRLVADRVIARLVANVVLARAEVAPSQDELDRFDREPGPLGLFAATWEVGHDDHVRLPFAFVEHVGARVRRDRFEGVATGAARGEPCQDDEECRSRSLHHSHDRGRAAKGQRSVGAYHRGVAQSSRLHRGLESVAPRDFFRQDLASVDAAIDAALDREEERQRTQLELIAPKNYMSRAARQALGSIIAFTSVEGYPSERWHAGTVNLDEIEELAASRARECFGCSYANVQPHSGTQANQAVFFALLEPGDTILSMSLRDGGHLSHGDPDNFSGRWFRAVRYGVGHGDGLIDYDDMEAVAHRERPRLLIVGGSSYPRSMCLAGCRDIARAVGAYLLADVAHFSGLVAAGVYPDPFPQVDVVTTSTNKNLRGPRGGLVVCDDEEVARKVHRGVFPGVQGGPLPEYIAAKAVCFGEALRPEFAEWAGAVL